MAEENISSEASIPKHSHRIHSLDGVRGIASLTVIFHHSLLVLPLFSAVYEGTPVSPLIFLFGFSPLHIFWAGQEAVIVFFVLSGYVLSMQFWSDRSVNYPAFLCRRVLRLYPAYYVSTVVAAILLSRAVSGPIPPMSWWYQYMNRPLNFSPGVIIEHLLLFVPARDNVFDGVCWTLVVEMLISLIFPLMIWGMRLLRVLALPVAILASLAIRHFLGVKTDHTIYEPIVNSLYYMWNFVAGAELARRRGLIAHWMSALSPGLAGLLLSTGLFFLTWRWTFPSTSERIIPFVWMIGAAIVISVAGNSSAVRKWLQQPALIFLGSVSYSAYLLHYPILMFLAPRMAAWGTPWLATILTPPLTLFFAWLSFRFIEVPGVALGNKWSRQISSRDAPTTLAARS